MNEMEKLIDEIEGELDLLAYFGKTQRCRETAIWCITRIAQAIESGKIPLTKVPPELPGEVWRADYQGYINNWAIDGELFNTEPAIEVDEGRFKWQARLIALPPKGKNDG